MYRWIQPLRRERSANLFPENSTTAVKYGFRKYLAHDWLGWVGHFDPPLQRNLQSVAMHPDSRPDRQHLTPQNTRLSKLAAATTIARTIDPKLLSKNINFFLLLEEFTSE